MPKSKMALTWDKFGEKYGPVTYLNVAGQSFLVLNSLEAAKELFGNRGSIYVDRPRFVMASELIGLSYITSFSRSGPEWKRQRALLKHALSAEVVKRDYSTQFERKAKQYVESLLDRPNDFLTELARIMAENVTELTYGRLKDRQGRDYLQLNSYVMNVVDGTMQGYVVDLIPALKHLPSWLPGMKFKRDASKWNKEIAEINRTMFEGARESVTSRDSDVQSCFMANNLKQLYGAQRELDDAQQFEEKELTIRQSGFSFFIGMISLLRSGYIKEWIDTIIIPAFLQGEAIR
ncbi:hypothetical protein FRC01_005441 [Tulasnella sp. 417]|nr:hypothetical protein FRC01_005441 [Tulasnella sp. 417]